MSVFFGTDGIRGVVNNSLTFDLAYRCGNAVGNDKKSPQILLGGDSRTSRSYLASAFSGGAMSAGANIIDIGVCPTAGISYLTKLSHSDYGVVISASHNPSEYNGIKIFDGNGIKLGDKREEDLERRFVHEVTVPESQIGRYEQDFSLVKKYEQYLASCCNTTLDGLTIVLDGSNGASSYVAPAVFRSLGAKVIATHCRCDGKHINDNCGSLFPEGLVRDVKRYKADLGFAFDGDSDRIIAVDHLGNIVDGDMIIFALAKYFKSCGKLKKNAVVGTTHTNMGIEEALKDEGITLLRTDIGDKYVIMKMEENDLSLGGEKSGHIIIKDYLPTGDGILTGVKLAEMVKVLGKSLHELCQVKLFPQVNINCTVFDKMKVINSEKLMQQVEEERAKLGASARVMVRVSGTEPKIRIMVEGSDIYLAEKSAHTLEETVHQVDQN